MRGNQGSPLWPYLGILTCLFLLSLAAPRTWQPPPLPDSADLKLGEVRLAELALLAEPTTSPRAVAGPGEVPAAKGPAASLAAPPEPQLPLLAAPSESFDIPYADLINSEEWNLDFDDILFDFQQGDFEFTSDSPFQQPSSPAVTELALPEPPPVISPLELSQQLFRFRYALLNVFDDAQTVAVDTFVQADAAAQRQLQSLAGKAARSYLKHRLSSRLERAKQELAQRVTTLPSQVGAAAREAARNNEVTRQQETPAGPQLPVRVTNRDDRLAMRPAAPRLTPRMEPLRAAPDVTPTPPPAWPWSAPEALLEQLDALAVETRFASWAGETSQQLKSLGRIFKGQDDQIASALDSLDALAKGVDKLAAGEADRHYVTRLLRTRYALRRRIDLWRALEPLRHEVEAVPSTARDGGENLASILATLAELTEGSERGKQWQTYLQLPQLAVLSSDASAARQDERRRLAEQVLARLRRRSISSAQRRFMRSPPLASLDKAMQAWVVRPIDLGEFSQRLERYELSRRAVDGQFMARAIRDLSWSQDEQQMAVAHELERHYRNANLRVAMHNDLLNRLMPEQSPIDSRVRGRIAGAEVRGRSRTSTDLHVKLINDPSRWRMGIVATGKVRTNTQSSSWPARFRNRGQLGYEAIKELAIGPEGFVVEPTQSKANGRTRLVDVETQLDPVPLVGGLVRVIARSQHERSRPMAIREVRSKLARQSRERMDKEADAKLAELEDRVRHRVLQPLAKLAVVAEPLEMLTTEERLVMRMRLANEHQLAAHTPRPRALSDSLASLQMHDSVINNSLAGFQLEGRSFPLPDLYRHVRQFFGGDAVEVPEDIPATTIVTFAPHDAARVQFDEGVLELTMSFAKVKHRRNLLRGFKLHAFYRPEVTGLDAKLTRDGTLQFEGRRIRTSTRLALQSVFTSLLAKDRPLRVLPTRFQTDPRFEGLMVTQLVLDDGWLGMGIGPQRPHRVAQRRR